MLFEFPSFCLAWLGAGSTGRLTPAFHVTHFPFKCFCPAKCEGLSKMTFCAEVAAPFPSPPPPGSPRQATTPWELERVLEQCFNSSSQPHNSKCAQAYWACMIKPSEFWLWESGWKAGSDKILLTLVFLTERSTLRLKSANSKCWISFCWECH